MKTDKRKTKVKFLMEPEDGDFKGGVLAIFPEIDYFTKPSDTKLAYCNTNQHSPCSMEYADKCSIATPEQYAHLKKELENIGYNLEILNL